MYKQERDSVCFRKGVTTSMETSLLAIVLLRKKMRWEPLSIRMCLGGWDLENVTSCSCFILFHWFHSDIQVATLNKRPLHSKLVLSLYSHRSAVHMCRSVYISIYIYIYICIALGGNIAVTLSNSTIHTPLSLWVLPARPCGEKPQVPFALLLEGLAADHPYDLPMIVSSAHLDSKAQWHVPCFLGVCVVCVSVVLSVWSHWSTCLTQTARWNEPP